MRTPLPLVIALSGVLLLGGCAGATPVPPPAPSAAPTGATAAPTPATTPAPSASSAPTVVTAGDCTAAEMDSIGGAIPTVYTVYTSDSTTPVTIQYMAFNHDGSNPIETLTTVGPVVNIIGYACTTSASSAFWTLKANMTTSDTVACVLDFGGLLVNNKSHTAEHSPAIPIHVDCSGNPGE